MSLGPNDRCWCGSGQKYKRCHRLLDEPIKAGKQSPERDVPDGHRAAAVHRAPGASRPAATSGW